MHSDLFTLELVRLIPEMTKRARSLAQHADNADDLMQGALLRALRNRDRFVPGSNLRAWFTVILRHELVDRWRATRRESAYDEERDGRWTAPDQEDRAQLHELRLALLTLTPEKRRALLAITVAGMAYEEAAVSLGCSPGTLKSRVSRARQELRDILERGRLPRTSGRSGHAATAILRAAEIAALPHANRRKLAA